MQLRIDDVAHGGEGLGRIDGKAVFVAGAVPGDVVQVEPVVDKARWMRARLVRVVEPAPERIEAPCPWFGTCGGCDWQMAPYPDQLRWKHAVVVGQLRHLGGAVPTVDPTVPSPRPFGYRNRMDFAVLAGRPALHRRAPHDLVAVDRCLLLQPDLTALYADLGDLDGARRITLRGSERTGERLVVVRGRVPEGAERWDASVVHVERGRVSAVRGTPRLHEEVAGRRFQISATSFFQVNTGAADRLVAVVAEAAAVEGDDVLLDAYAGVGLFSATLGAAAASVIAVESSGSSVADLRANTADLTHVRPIRGRVERMLPGFQTPWTVAVADPPRAGLGRAGVDALTGPRPERIVLVACDPASLGRDTRLLAEAGYRIDRVTPLDLFPQTHHVEAVARFTQSSSSSS